MKKLALVIAAAATVLTAAPAAHAAVLGKPMLAQTGATEMSSRHRHHFRHYGWYRGHHYGWYKHRWRHHHYGWHHGPYYHHYGWYRGPSYGWR